MNTSSKGPCILLTWVSENPYHEPSMPPGLKELRVATVAMNPSAVWKSMRTKHSFIILMSVIFFEWNGSYGNAAFKLKKSFSVKIPIWDLLESDDHKLIRFPFDLTGSTIATIVSDLPFQSLRKGVTESETARWLLRENHRSSWYSWFFRQKLAFG